MLQPRFERRSGRRALRLLEHPRFRAAYDFLLLRAESGEIEQELADWWTDIQDMSADERIAEVEGRHRSNESRRRNGTATAQPSPPRVVAAAQGRPPPRDHGSGAAGGRAAALGAGVRRARQQPRRALSTRSSARSRRLRGLPQCRLVLRSSLYRSRPMGPRDAAGLRQRGRPGC